MRRQPCLPIVPISYPPFSLPHLSSTPPPNPSSLQHNQSNLISTPHPLSQPHQSSSPPQTPHLPPLFPSIVLKSCADINEAIELNDSTKMIEILVKDTSFLEQVVPEYADRYMQEFREDKETNIQVRIARGGRGYWLCVARRGRG